MTLRDSIAREDGEADQRVLWILFYMVAIMAMWFWIPVMMFYYASWCAYWNWPQ